MTISITPNAYPIFEANQVLKFSDLNSLFDYLDGHNRLTRTHLIGMGIVCGLKVTRTTSAAIAISPGCGVTSEGYLIRLDKTTLTHFDEVSVDKRLFEGTPPTTPPQPTRENGNGNGNGNGNANGNSNLSAPRIDVIELFEGAGEDTDRQPLSSDIVNDHVLVVVCEIDESQRDSCLADCDNRGRDRQLRGRYFLLPRTAGGGLTADALLRQGYQIDSLEAPWDNVGTEEAFTAPYTFWQDAQLRVRRFGYDTETPTNSDLEVPIVRLSAIKTFDALMENYYQICEEAIAQIEPVFTNLYRLFSPLFSTFQPDSPAAFEGLSEHLQERLNLIRTSAAPSQLEAVEAQYAIQYFYDYLSQLVAAYDELTTVAFELMADCVPDRRRFPKYLMLGIPAADEQSPCDPPSPYRTHFVQPPIYNGNGKRLQQVQHLYQRLLKLCAKDAFFLLPFYDTPLAITPSPDRSAPLSQQAIPYYLNYPQIYRYWNYDACRKGISDRHPAYFFPLSSGTPATTTDVLVHRLDAYNFYRIEGHIGETRANALEQIKNYQQRYSLAFDVITLKLSPDIESLRDSDLSGHFDDLEADYGRIKDQFRKLWIKNEEDWSRNVFLNTLRREFFVENDDATISGLLDLREDQVQNPVLALAQNPDNYEFVPREGATGLYELYVVDRSSPVFDEEGNRRGDLLARFSPQSTSNDELIDFSELSDEEANEERKRIRETLAACFALGKVEFQVIQESRLRFYVRLVVDDSLMLPNRPDAADMALLWLSPFTVSFSRDQEPFIAQAEYHNFETLYRLLNDTPDSFNEEQLFQMGNQEAADCLNYFEFKGLLEVYRQRLVKLKELHLFYKFAEQHPGLEPLGGVPQGGTLVLVYVDGEAVVNDLKVEQNTAFRARTSAIKQFAGFPFQFLAAARVQEEVLNRVDMVVADFCLPYRCCSDTPAVSYLLAKPRPIVLLEKSAFCEDDSGEYDFILDPAGGTLKGDGVAQREDGTYFFQPNQIEQTRRDRTVTFIYAVEGSYDTFTVAIYPDPIGTLNIEDGDQFCNDDESIDIRLVQANDPAVELGEVTINGEMTERFEPARYAQNGEFETLTLVASLQDTRTQCTTELRIEFEVYPLPDPTFRFEPPPTTDGYCAELGESGTLITFTPNDPNLGSSEFSIDGFDGDLIGGNQISLAFFGGIDKPLELTVKHVARNEANCENSDTAILKIYPIPTARIGELPSNVCSADGPIDLQLTSSNGTNTLGEADRLQVFVGGDRENEIEGAIDPQTLQFIPSAVLSRMGDNDNRLGIEIVYTVTSLGDCTNSATTGLTVHRTPQPELEVGELDISSDGVTVPLTVNVPGNVAEFSFGWQPRRVQRGEANNFEVFYTPAQLDELRQTEGAIVIRLRVIYSGSNLRCPSEEVEVRLPIPDLDNDDGDDDGDDRPPSDPEGGGGGPDNPSDDPVIVNRPPVGGGSGRIVANIFNPTTLESATPLFNERLNRYREQLLAIGRGDSDIEGSRAFSEAEDFIARRDKGVDDFRQLVETLQRSFRPSGPERQGELIEVLAIATAALFDHLAQTATGETNLAALELLLEELRQSELNLSRVREFWEVEPLISVADPVLLERLEEQL